MAGGKIAINGRGCNAAGSILFRRQTTVESPRKRFRSAASRHAIAMRRLFTSRRCRSSPTLIFQRRCGQPMGMGVVQRVERVCLFSYVYFAGRFGSCLSALWRRCCVRRQWSRPRLQLPQNPVMAVHGITRTIPVVRRRGGILPIVMIGTAGTSLAGMPASSGRTPNVSPAPTAALSRTELPRAPVSPTASVF